jgi:hypothetical protein
MLKANESRLVSSTSLGLQKKKMVCITGLSIRPAARRCASRPHIEVPEGETLTGRRNQDYIDVASERLYVGASGDEFSLIDNNIRPQFVAENLMSYLLY